MTHAYAYKPKKNAGTKPAFFLFWNDGAVSGELAVAMLEFLARAAGAYLIAADFAPTRGIAGIALSLRSALRRAAITGEHRRQRRRYLVIAGRRIDFVGLHVRQLALLFRRRLLHDLDAHQLRGDLLAQTRHHGLEQAEGLGLVFVERIALAVAAQADHLAQMFQHDQMLAPEMVDGLQQDRLLDIAPDVG